MKISVMFVRNKVIDVTNTIMGCGLYSQLKEILRVGN